MRTEEELRELLGKAEDAMNSQGLISGQPTPDSPSGWGFGQLGDYDQLSGLVAGLRYALGIPNKLAEDLSEKGGARWLQDMKVNRANQLAGLHDRLRNFREEMGGQNG